MGDIYFTSFSTNCVTHVMKDLELTTEQTNWCFGTVNLDKSLVILGREGGRERKRERERAVE